MGVNSFPKTVIRQRRDCDLNPGPTAPESSTLITRLPKGRPTGRIRPRRNYYWTRRVDFGEAACARRWRRRRRVWSDRTRLYAAARCVVSSFSQGLRVETLLMPRSWCRVVRAVSGQQHCVYATTQSMSMRVRVRRVVEKASNIGYVRNVRRILVGGGSMPPCRLRRRKF